MIQCPNCNVFNHPIRDSCAKCGLDITEIKKEWKKNNPSKKNKPEISEYDHPLEKVNKKEKEKETDNINILEKTANITKSFFNHAVNGFKTVNDSIQIERFEICKKCELYEESNKTCKECGCYLEIKTLWASEKCPLGKWGVVESKDQHKQLPSPRSNFPKTCGGCGGKKT